MADLQKRAQESVSDVHNEEELDFLLARMVAEYKILANKPIADGFGG